ncbi:hypothetical protein ASG88_04480 [Nocardioides sp. Soil777]|uniref:hypothetical protein n=1 Tax=Nocardioides sp. Soil777 TaxID=1736409 RepID=UPI000703BBA6|nr:hypothetical protein [Nocardioides sp. Soil777]KRF02632.1 hypothetical protein ASG88_04480 [Nocardioides sp. Soil777]
MIEQDATTEAKTEALRNVVGRVTSWQESATDGTIREELDSALAEVGIDLTDAQREAVTQHISDGHEVDVAALAADRG